jgi:hypothetical protein
MKNYVAILIYDWNSYFFLIAPAFPLLLPFLYITSSILLNYPYIMISSMLNNSSLCLFGSNHDSLKLMTRTEYSCAEVPSPFIRST